MAKEAEDGKIKTEVDSIDGRLKKTLAELKKVQSNFPIQQYFRSAKTNYVFKWNLLNLLNHIFIPNPYVISSQVFFYILIVFLVWIPYYLPKLQAVKPLVISKCI